ncbi:saccharopine dehydrogenase domain-containing protein [Thecamonas trahens ATCC 50062]|uniref:Saccharopine dehydrogenase domain-containing protein n=1 Tax=Thecamonas trahens ATCC 50062 TaxID=461836 RepID=A0A0L0DW21_THETB|nr:saccharopine dehydrogenase domain-containing protein [Thecamonas trahens ATCC 50062]KNC56372.1 saccharopine dehydrogenase domain-containing protein [Thecamonas trahens ATCC 50062]|eukprot:XP_013760887.1 saccharopine dehydrogenase domain-containing protein [Thecamonas trahens ATCC 50062]
MYDLVIYGASGFTGSRIAHQAVRILGAKVSLALAGRTQAKLEAVKRELCHAFPDLAPALASKVGIIIASTADVDSLAAMAGVGKVVVNAVGPFRMHGEPVVAACAAAGTDYVDVSGEPEFIETMAARYDDAAKASGALIVSACGMDSIPCDMGVVHAAQLAAAEGLVPTAIEAYLSVSTAAVPGVGSVVINAGTWDSLIYSFANVAALRALRRAHPMPRLEFDARRSTSFPRRGKTFTPPADVGAAYAVPFMGADASVVRRSQAARQAAGDKPVRFGVFLTLPSLKALIMYMAWGFVFGIFASFRLGRSFLLRFPFLCSLGKVSRDGPNAVTRAATTLSLNMVTKAVPADAADPASTDAPPVATLHTRIEINDPGYDGTAACVVQCAATMLEERTALPPGGVTTSAAAFAGSKLLDRLADSPITFTRVAATSSS